MEATERDERDEPDANIGRSENSEPEINADRIKMHESAQRVDRFAKVHFRSMVGIKFMGLLALASLLAVESGQMSRNGSLSSPVWGRMFSFMTWC